MLRHVRVLGVKPLRANMVFHDEIAIRSDVVFGDAYRRRDSGVKKIPRSDRSLTRLLFTSINGDDVFVEEGDRVVVGEVRDRGRSLMS